MQHLKQLKSGFSVLIRVDNLLSSAMKINKLCVYLYVTLDHKTSL